MGKKIILVIVIITLFISCGQLYQIDVVKEKYPEGTIYFIKNKQYIVITKNEEIRYIRLGSFGEEIIEDRILRQAVGYKYLKKKTNEHNRSRISD
jgi:hypothetical protein